MAESFGPETTTGPSAVNALTVPHGKHYRNVSIYNGCGNRGVFRVSASDSWRRVLNGTIRTLKGISLSPGDVIAIKGDGAGDLSEIYGDIW